MNDGKETYTVYEMADRMSVTPTTIYSWIKAGLEHTYRSEGLKAFKVLSQEDVDDFLRKATSRTAKDFE